MEQAAKEARWQRIEDQCTRITDALDEPIDPDILQLVVGLNALDIATSSSCAGHLDHGTYAPYVDVEAAIDREEERAARQALLAAQQEEERAQLSQEEIDKHYQDATELQQQAAHPHLALRARLSEYLTRFYAQRHVSFNQHLVIQGEVLQNIGCAMRLESQGAGLQAIATPEERAQNLAVYQQEMRMFAAFLKDVYFA